MSSLSRIQKRGRFLSWLQRPQQENIYHPSYSCPDVPTCYISWDRQNDPSSAGLRRVDEYESVLQLHRHFLSSVPTGPQNTQPVLLLVDGLKAHQSLEVSKFCRENGIILYRLPPNATHILQPNDLSKAAWAGAEWNFQFQNPGDYVTRTTFARVFSDAWK